MGNGSVNPIEELGSRPSSASDPNSAAWQAVRDLRNKGMSPEEIQAQAKANYDKIHAKNVNSAQDQLHSNGVLQHQLDITAAVTSGKSTLPVNLGFDFGAKLAAKAAGADTIGQTSSPAAAGAPSPVAPGQPAAPQQAQRPQAIEQQAVDRQTEDTASPNVVIQTKQAVQTQAKGEAVSSEGGADEITGKAQLGGQLHVGDKKVQGVSSHTTNTSAQDMTINAADLLNVGAEATVTANTATDGRNDGETGGDSGRQHR